MIFFNIFLCLNVYVLPPLVDAMSENMTTETGGGAHVGGNASAGKNFTGRDHTQYSRDANINIQVGDDHDQPQRRSRVPLAERVEDLERYMYGDVRAGEPGLIKRARTQLRWSQANTVLLVVVILMAAALLNAPH